MCAGHTRRVTSHGLLAQQCVVESRTASQLLKHRLLLSLHAALQVGATDTMLKRATPASTASTTGRLCHPTRIAQAPCRGAIPSLGVEQRFDECSWCSL